MRGNRRLWRGLCGVVVALLTACTPQPQPAKPALWQVTAPNGARGWLFGTIHALPRPMAWQTPSVAAALGQAGELVVEVAGLNDHDATQRAFQALARAPAPLPLARRLPAADAPALAALLDRGHLNADDLAHEKSWAAALTLNAAAHEDASGGNGVDQALLAGSHLPVAELEGAAAQFAVFDHLSEASQRAMLAQVVRAAASANADTRRLATAWAQGDMVQIAHETQSGLLAEPGLRAALFTRRNQAWLLVIARAIAGGKRPFVAVGAAHMAGPQGLVALLNAAGWRVERME